MEFYFVSVLGVHQDGTANSLSGYGLHADQKAAEAAALKLYEREYKDKHGPVTSGPLVSVYHISRAELKRVLAAVERSK